MSARQKKMSENDKDLEGLSRHGTMERRLPGALMALGILLLVVCSLKLLATHGSLMREYKLILRQDPPVDSALKKMHFQLAHRLHGLNAAVALTNTLLAIGLLKAKLLDKRLALFLTFITACMLLICLVAIE